MKLDFQNGRFLHNVQKGVAETEVLRLLRSFLDANEPGLVRFLVNTWNSQGKAITYKEIREAIVAGEINSELLEEWQQDYTRFVRQYLRPTWELAMAEATKALEEKYPGWYFDPMSDGIQEWVSNRAAEFVTNSTGTQIDGLRAVIQRAATLEDMSTDQLARAIRPMIGLTRQQSIANFNYYNTLISSGMSEKKAMELATRYSARQHRYRAYNIARTELAFAYNKGADEGIRQAQEAGYIGEMVKVWSTADDERTCEICGGLEGKICGLDDDFEFASKLAGKYPTVRRLPPAHPSCRCAVMYKEIDSLS